MANLVEQSAQMIADALAPSPSIPGARWRWGTVESIGVDGTMTVSIGGATVPGIRAAQHVMGAQVGDRVRVLYCGTECMVDAIRATDGTPHIDAQEWLDALGLTVENRTLTPNTSNVTMQGENYARSFGKVVQLNLVFTTNKQIPTWDNQNFIVGTMDRACAYSKQYMTAIAQIGGQWTLMQAGINSSGEVRLRTVGTAIPNGTWTWVFGTYISV